jgi:hypothetical protein
MSPNLVMAQSHLFLLSFIILFPLIYLIKILIRILILILRFQILIKRGSKSLAPTRYKYCFAGGMEITLDVEKMGQLLNLKPSLVLKDLVKESFRRDELDL